MLSPQSAAVQRMFFDYLMNEANKGNTNLFFDNSVLHSKYNKSGITALKNGEFIEGDFSGYFLQIQKGKEIAIEHQDTIVDYKYNLYKPFIYSNVLEDDVTDEQYRKYGNKKELLAVINEVLFSKWLSGNFFSDEDKINADAVLKRNILLSRDAIFAWQIVPQPRTKYKGFLRKSFLHRKNESCCFEEKYIIIKRCYICVAL